MVVNTMPVTLYMEDFNQNRKNNMNTLKQPTLKIIFKIMLIIAAFGGTLLILNRIFTLKSEDGIEQMKSYYKQKENTVDALFVGSSHVFCHVNTGVLWQEYGISAYDLAGAEQPYWNSYYYIKEALKTQSPKVICLEISTPGIRPIDNQPENWLITNTYGIRLNANRFGAIKASATENAFARLLVPFNSTHGRYVDLTEDDFTDANSSINYKGFDPRETTVAFDKPDISNVTNRTPLSEKEEKYLRMIIEYTKLQNIPLMFFSSPYVVEADEQAKYNTVFDIADECGIPYIDFNKRYDAMGLDFETDMAEVLHLNRSGNQKFTKYLGKCLTEMYDLKDHRGERKYASWDVDALYQTQDDLNYEIFTAGSNHDVETVMDLISVNANYTIFVSIPANCNLNNLNPNEKAKLEVLLANKQSPSGLASDSLYVFSNNSTIHYSNSISDCYTYKDGNRILMLKKEFTDGIYATVLRTNGMRTNNGISGYEDFNLSETNISIVVYDNILDKLIANFEMGSSLTEINTP